MLAVEILVESVVVARGVLQQERRWPRLPRLVAARDEIGMRVRIADIDPHRLVPAIGDRRQVRIDRPAEIGDDARQRIREVLVFTPPEAVPRHDHMAPEPAGVIVETGDCFTLVGGQKLFDHRPALVIEVRRDAGPVEHPGTGVDADRISLCCFYHVAHV